MGGSSGKPYETSRKYSINVTTPHKYASSNCRNPSSNRGDFPVRSAGSEFFLLSSNPRSQKLVCFQACQCLMPLPVRTRTRALITLSSSVHQLTNTVSSVTMLLAYRTAAAAAAAVYDMSSKRALTTSLLTAISPRRAVRIQHFTA